MGVDVNTWRVRIGLYMPLNNTTINKPSKVFFVQTEIFSMTIRLIVYLCILIILCGDVEINPGPNRKKLRGRGRGRGKTGTRNPENRADLKDTPYEDTPEVLNVPAAQSMSSADSTLDMVTASAAPSPPVKSSMSYAGALRMQMSLQTSLHVSNENLQLTTEESKMVQKQESMEYIDGNATSDTNLKETPNEAAPEEVLHVSAAQSMSCADSSLRTVTASAAPSTPKKSSMSYTGATRTQMSLQPVLYVSNESLQSTTEECKMVQKQETMVYTDGTAKPDRGKQVKVKQMQQTESKDTLNKNWVKAALGLCVVRECIQGFVIDIVRNFHLDIYNKVMSSRGLVIQCNTCTTQNVLECPTKGICEDGSSCTYHDSSDRTRKVCPCPNGICNKIRDAVIDAHRFNTPSFKNTSAKLWCSHPWEIAKCYMPPGYSDINTSEETDFSGLVNVIIHLKYFENYIAENLRYRDNSFKKARDVRNKIMHNPTLELRTAKMNIYFQRLTAVLLDRKHIQNLPEAKAAMDKLEKYKHDSQPICPEDVEKIRKEFRDELSREADEILNLFQNRLKDGIRELGKTIEEGSKLLKLEAKSGVDKLERMQTEAIASITEEKRKLSCWTEIVYDRRKKKLQKQLIDYYISNGLCKLPVSALLYRKEVDIDDMFVMPALRIDRHGARPSSNNFRDDENHIQCDITAIHELFKKDGQRIRRSCVAGDAGSGKTTLCQKILSSWCRIHNNTETINLSDSDRSFLEHFEYLFYICLRDTATSSYDVVDMIKADIVREGLHDCLIEILREESEKCMIILDGLDEWLQAESCRKMLPFFDKRENFSVLITSRPWRISLLGQDISKMEQEIELHGLTNKTDLVRNVVEFFNTKYNETKRWEDFEYGFLPFGMIEHLSQIPVILTQMVYMWYHGVEDFGHTRVEIYGRMVEYLFEVTDKRHPDVPKQNMPAENGKSKSQKSRKKRLPSFFKGFTFCDKYNKTLKKISDLAFRTLFSKTKEASISFPITISREILSTDDMEFCLSTGLLSQTEVSNSKTPYSIKTHFIHKSFQDFLAAFFVAAEGHENDIAEMFGALNSLDDVFEFSQVLMFLCGFRPDFINVVSCHIAKLAENDKKILEYRHSMRDVHRGFISKIQFLISDCLNEGLNYISKEKVCFELRDVIFDDIENEADFFLCLNVQDVISYSESVWSRWPRLALSKLAKLHVGIDVQEHVDKITTLMQECTPTLTSIGIIGTTWSYNMNMNTIFDDLPRFKNLTCINFTFIVLSHSKIEAFVAFLSRRIQLRELILDKINCESCEPEQCAYTIDLSNHKQLHYLNVHRLEGNFKMSNKIPLGYCSLEDNTFSMSILEGLKSSTRLQYLSVVKTFPDPITAYDKSYVNMETNIYPEPWLADYLLEQGTLFGDPFFHRHPVKEEQSSELTVPPSIANLPRTLTNVIPTLTHLFILKLEYMDFTKDILRLSTEMRFLEEVYLQRVRMPLLCLEEFINSLPHTIRPLLVNFKQVDICSSDDLYPAVDYIADNCNVKWNDSDEEKSHLYIGFTNKIS